MPLDGRSRDTIPAAASGAWKDIEPGHQNWRNSANGRPCCPTYSFHASIAGRFSESHCRALAAATAMLPAAAAFALALDDTSAAMESGQKKSTLIDDSTQCGEGASA